MAEALKKEAKKRRSSAKGVFHRIYNSLQLKAESDEQEEVWKSILRDLETAYSNVQDMSNRYGESLE